MSRILVWIYLITQYKIQRGIWIVVGIFSVFDHFLISQSLPVVLIWFLILFSNFTLLQKTVVIRSFCVYMIVNGVLAVFQFISGHSLGLSWIGESTLDVNTIGGVAKQKILGYTFLRGYGLLPHPNMTGFLGVVGLLFADKIQINREVTLKQPFHNRWKALVRIISAVLICLSFSRTAWIAGLVATAVSSDSLFGWWKHNTPKNHWYEGAKITPKIQVLVVIAMMSISVFALTITRNDLYRTSDLQLWFDTFSSLDVWHKLFGIGFGQYPFYLKSHYSILEPWQWQPAHTIWLNLIIEGGLVCFILGIILVFTILNNKNPIQKP